MRDLKFRPPNKPEVINPPTGWLREVVLDGDEQYWSGGSGDGSLWTKVGSDTVSLGLILKEPYGFVVQYGKADSTEDFVAISSTDYSRTVQVWLGGNPWTVPTAFLVNRQKAWEAVEHFCRTGEMCKS